MALRTPCFDTHVHTEAAIIRALDRMGGFSSSLCELAMSSGYTRLEVLDALYHLEALGEVEWCTYTGWTRVIKP